MTAHYTKHGYPLNHFGVLLGLDQFPHISHVHKFGGSTALTTVYQPVCHGAVYQTPTTATDLEILSDSSADTTADVGGWTVMIEGIGSTWGAISEEVTLSGTSPVALANAYTRIYRMYVTGSGYYADQSQGSHAGTLTVRTTGGAATWGIISASDFQRGQSEIGVYTIPGGKTGYVYVHHVSSDSNKAVDYILFHRANCDTVSAPFSAMRMVREYAGVQGMQVITDDSAPEGPFVGPCDIGFMAKAAATSEVSVEFEVVLFNTET